MTENTTHKDNNPAQATDTQREGEITRLKVEVYILTCAVSAIASTLMTVHALEASRVHMRELIEKKIREFDYANTLPDGKQRIPLDNWGTTYKKIADRLVVTLFDGNWRGERK